ncbi:carboxypeptidase-like regulatory domain-containing protein [Sediminicola arcticus]|jgi:hypothetical protein|uniref:Carboxypeptidase-like regulatory domain-containing protein n=1 Tax=Sediminicola arcticus TaxID=1574308 RepID=A0ABV2SRB8_9FLAO
MNKLFVIGILLISGLGFAQNDGSVRGTILDYDMNNEPMLYANIKVKNTSYSAETNFHGNFEIPNVEPGNYTLVISYLGYETLELPLVVSENNVTEIHDGLETKKLTLGDISSLDYNNDSSSIELRTKL